ncbi:hypothetical protein Ancab_004365, partial [Ancistrocladus abbreviatus]
CNPHQRASTRYDGESNSGPTYSHASADLDPEKGQDPLPKDRAGKPMKKSLSHKGRACGLGPKLSGAYRSKPRPSKGKGKSFKKGSNSKCPSASNTRGPLMNQIFPSKFNLVTADKIWKVRKRLGV